MAAALKDLEKQLNTLFVDKAPALPKNAKKVIVQYLPYLNLVAGIFSLWAAWTLWHWAHTVDRWVDYANHIARMYGGPSADVNHLSFMVWVSLLVLAFEAVLYILAFPATKARQKKGWDLLFYALLVNVVYGAVVMFTNYGDFGNLVGSVIGTAIGLYFLFQIRSEYLGGKADSKSAGKAPKK